MNYHEILNILLYNKSRIIKLWLICFMLVLLILIFVYPRTYIATTSILPPEKNTNMSGLSSLIAGADLTSLMSAGLSTASSQLYIEMLKSRSAAEYVIKKLNLVEYLNVENMQEAEEELSKRLILDITKDGVVRIGVETKTPLIPMIENRKDSAKNLAARISNTYVEALDKINRAKLSSKAKNARIYIEEQLKLTKSKLDSAEFALMQFQQRNKTISLPEQMKAVIEGAAQLKSEILQTEVQIGLMKTNLQEDNKVLIGLRDKLSNLQAQYEKMEFGSQDFLLAFKDVPELGRELAALLRDVKIQNEVYLILQQQYYKEKIQENKDIPTIEVLDTAIPPIKASGPGILSSSVLGALVLFIIISVIILISEKKALIIYKKV